MTQSKIDHILNLISEGNKLAAVKELKDNAQISLKESAEIINSIVEGKESDLNVCLQRIKGDSSLGQSPTHTAVGTYISQSKIEEIQELIHKGTKLAAVKVLMDASGIDLKQAKEIIDNFSTDTTIDINARIAAAKNNYSDTYESISASCDANGTNVHFYYQKGNVKEEVTPGHPMWERIRQHYSTLLEGAPEEINKAREPFIKAVLEMEAQAGYTPKKESQNSTSSEKKNTLFIKRKSFDLFKWYFFYFIAAIITYIIYLVVSN